MFGRITDAYGIADEAIRARIGPPPGAVSSVEFDELYQLLELTANAYFFMLFARFEQLVTERALARVEMGRRSPNLGEGRVWWVLDVRKMDFLRRLALLTDKGSPDYATVKELYEDRNAIAHGKLAETKPNVMVLATILSGIIARLEGTP